MIFTKLELKNFRSYFGSHTIEFSSNADRPVTVIVGKNGHGKTTIFDGLCWCLYGEQYLRQEKIDLLTIPNENAVKVGDDFTVECRLEFTHDDVTYRMRRQFACRGEQGGRSNERAAKITSLVKTALKKVRSDGTVVPVSEFTSFINEILPSNVRSYFLFNGDRIDHFSTPEASSIIKDGIYRVVDLELVQDGVKHLRKEYKYYTRRLAMALNQAGDLEAETLEKRKAEKMEFIETAREKIVHNKSQLTTNSDRIARYKDSLLKLDETKDAEMAIDSLTDELSGLENKLVDIDEVIRNKSSFLSMAFVKEEIEALRSRLDELSAAGEIPNTSLAQLRESELTGVCTICGRNIVEGEEAHEHIVARIAEGEDRTDDAAAWQKVHNTLFEIREGLIDSKKKLKEALVEQIETKNTIKTRMAKRQTEEDKLKDLPKGDTKDLLANYDQAKQDRLGYEEGIRDAQDRIVEWTKEVKELDGKIGQLDTNSAEVRLLRSLQTVADKAAEALDNIFEEFAEDSRLKVELATGELWPKMIQNIETLRVGIDDDFHYEIVDQNGNDAMAQLAMGQRQCLSFAYIMAITKVSQKDPPLVIDMPIARLDAEVQLNVLDVLSQVTPQLIVMLLPGSEWNERTQEVLVPRSDSMYELKFDEAQRETRVTEITGGL
jgi:DNA sulfur modification protein DndD